MPLRSVQSGMSARGARRRNLVVGVFRPLHDHETPGAVRQGVRHLSRCPTSVLRTRSTIGVEFGSNSLARSIRFPLRRKDVARALRPWTPHGIVAPGAAFNVQLFTVLAGHKSLLLCRREVTTLSPLNSAPESVREFNASRCVQKSCRPCENSATQKALSEFRGLRSRRARKSRKFALRATIRSFPSSFRTVCVNFAQP